MIYTNVTGRLGNQLFYYAITRKVQIERRDNQGIVFIWDNPKAEDGFGDSLQYFNVVDYRTDTKEYFDKNEGELKLTQRIFFSMFLRMNNILGRLDSLT